MEKGQAAVQRCRAKSGAARFALVVSLLDKKMGLALDDGGGGRSRDDANTARSTQTIPAGRDAADFGIPGSGSNVVEAPDKVPLVCCSQSTVRGRSPGNLAVEDQQRSKDL